MIMGRTPTRNKYLPAGMRARHRGDKTYYFLDTGAKPRKEIALGQDYVAAVQEWARLTESARKTGGLITFRHVAERYLREVLHTKGASTQEINLRELSNLYKFFDNPPGPLEEIDPIHIRQYMSFRVREAIKTLRETNEERRLFNLTSPKKPRKIVAETPTYGQVPANREKALFSHIWNFAREQGLTNKANPCSGIKGYTEDGRDVYIDDAVYSAVWQAAEQPLRDALDLAYLIGQRPADTLKMTRRDIVNGAVLVEQNKTGKKVRVSIEGELKVVVDRIEARKVSGLKLITTLDGQPFTKSQLRGAFDRARLAAAAQHPDLAEDIKKYQFRDLRAKAGTDTDEHSGIAAAQEQLGHSTPMMTAQYIRHRRGKLVKPTK
jgi:integrase